MSRQNALLIATALCALTPCNVGNAVAAGVSDKVASGNGSTVLVSSPSPSGAFTLFSSSDGGTTWIPTGLAGVSVNAIAVDPANAATLYAGTSMGVLKSADRGFTWNQLWPQWGQEGTNAGVNIFVMSPQNPCALYIGTSDLDYTQGVNYASTDCGTSWPFTVLLPNTTSQSIAATQSPTLEMLYTANGMLCTSIYSQSSTHCEVIGGAVPAGSITTVATAPSNLCWAYVGTGNGFVYTNNRCTPSPMPWIDTGARFPRPVEVLAIHPNDPFTVLAGTWAYSGNLSKVYRTIGTSWGEVGTFDSAVKSIVFDPSNPVSVYASTWGYLGGPGAAIYKSTDGGATWNPTSFVSTQPIVLGIGGTPSTIYAGTRAQGLRFVPTTPCRVVDTRNLDGPFGGPYLADQGARNFDLPGSACGIPSDARAYSLNVTVVPTGPLGYVTVWPAGAPQPLVSTLNSLDGRTKANAAIVPAGVNGAISVFASNATDLVIDVNGYFVPSTDAWALSFYPAAPCRIRDTRLIGGALAGGETRPFAIANVCGIPVAAQAYSLNITTVPKGPLGYVTIWPHGGTQPVVSTLNAPTGAVTANAAIVGAGTGGQIDIFASNETDLVVDVNGYFAPPATGGLSFYAAAPCRVVDTRLAEGPFGAPALDGIGDRTFALPAGSCTVPRGGAYSLNATVVPSGALGYLTLWRSGDAMPLVSTLNSLDGTVTANAAIVPAAANGSISSFASNPAHLVLDINGYFAP